MLDGFLALQWLIKMNTIKSKKELTEMMLTRQDKIFMLATLDV